MPDGINNVEFNVGIRPKMDSFQSSSMESFWATNLVSSLVIDFLFFCLHLLFVSFLAKKGRARTKIGPQSKQFAQGWGFRSGVLSLMPMSLGLLEVHSAAVNANVLTLPFLEVL